MVWRIDSEERKTRVLKMIVESYIKDFHPVSSEYLRRVYGLPASSATIRGIMSDLEDEDLLFHAHTSSGRIPTPRGFRFYVDFLMDLEDEILFEEMDDFYDILRADIRRRNFEYLLEDITRLISETTHYAGIAKYDRDRVFFWGTSRILNQPDFENISRLRDIFRVLEEKTTYFSNLLEDSLDKEIKVLIGDEISLEEMRDCSLVISSLSIDEGEKIVLGALGPVRMNYPYVLNRVRAVKNFLENQIFGDGYDG